MVWCSLLVANSLFCQWQPDVRLTVNDSTSALSLNNGRAIAAGPAGELHVVWHDERDAGFGAEEIYYRRSTDAGSTWSQDICLSMIDNKRSWTPSVAVSDSNVYVVWYDECVSSGAIMCRQSTDRGGTWSPYAVISGGGAWTAVSGYPSLSADGPSIHVVWTALNQFHSTMYVGYCRSTDNGESWYDAALTDSTVDNIRDETASVAVSGSDVHVAWKRWDNTNGSRIYYKKSLDGGATWSAEQNLVPPPSQNRCPALAVCDSLVHVVWHDNDGGCEIYYKRSTDRGITWSDKIPLTQDTYWVNFYPSIAGSGLNVHAVWEESYGTRGIAVRYRGSTDGGLTWDQPSTLTTDTTSWGGMLPSIAVGDTAVHLVWSDGRDGNPEIYYKRNPTGNPLAIDDRQKYPAKIQMPFKVWPNPFVCFTTVPGNGNDRFALYDLSGRHAGTCRGDRIGENLSPGVYFLKSEKDGEAVRIIKVR